MMCSDGDCSACPSNAELLACTPNNQCISVPPHASVETSNGLGGIHTCAVTGMGGVKCWGANYDGQLGDGTTFNRLSPRDVAGLSGPVKAVALGSSHTCALLETGAIQCWGENEYGELGDGTTTQSSSPVNVLGLGGVAIAIGAGANHTCALLDTGKSKCWGQGDFGRKLGDNTLNNSATPVDVTDVTETATTLSSGDNHNCVLTTSAKMLCWGATDSSPPGINATVIAIDAGDNHDCAVLTSGGIRCSGENDYGQLGNGMTGFSGTRIDVIGLASQVKQVSAGDEHTCALLDTGGVQCWGRNNKGQLGDGTNTDRHTPVNVTGLSSDVLVIAAGRRTTCALLTSGEVKCWGSNIYGQLGDGTETDRNTPTSIGLDLF
jgi:alpha-tubulin suppressor-like RCC1 family protein